ncbi:ComF family protein [Agromyces subbeticus]|uniref:ComF family protein n=1 Tax=Agromyces subbeticus TaxID=293890 RepID=UPI0003B45444|nr:phosphoribosyltransferase family protein [Agromyces subbeticus]
MDRPSGARDRFARTSLVEVGRHAVEAVRDATAVLLPVTCSGCGAFDRSVCGDCRRALLAHPRRVERAGLEIWAGLAYRGSAAAVIGAFKDGGRADAAGALAPALGTSVHSALAAVPSGRPIEVCTIPSSPAARRSRGYVPVEVLLGRCGIRSSSVLAFTRLHADQAGLDAEARRRNSAGGLVARPDRRWKPRSAAGLLGRRFLLVDDIVTTGSTLAEAVRALAAAGAETAAIAVLAETPLRFPRHAGKSR